MSMNNDTPDLFDDIPAAGSTAPAGNLPPRRPTIADF